MINVLTVLISGIFAVLVASLTVWLSTRKEAAALRRSETRERRAKIENLYADEIACTEKVIRYTQRKLNYGELFDELSRINARMTLSASPEVLELSGKLSDVLFEWSTEHRQGTPQQSGDSDIAYISSSQTPHRKKAEELYPKVIDASLVMVEAMRRHLKQIDGEK